MANKDGTSKGSRKSRRLNYFYLNGKLHKRLQVNRGEDTIVAWCYPDHCRVAYTYSDVLRFKENAFTMVEVGTLINRSRVSIENAIIRGDIEAPQFTYGLNERKNKFKYMFSEKDVLAAHAYFSSVHQGRPRKDGLVTVNNMPSAREVRAMMRDEEILYVRQGDKFVPTWRAENF